MLTDTHAHLFWDSYQSDLDQVLDNCLQSGITTIINVGVDVESSQKAAHLADRGKIHMYSSIGIHPHEAAKYAKNPKVLIQKDIAQLEEIYFQNPQKVIAVGECGLDYLIDPSFFPPGLTIDQYKHLQLLLFKSQIELAKKLNLPLLIHCRDDRSKNPQNTDCWDETLKLTKNHFGIYHCYSGLPHNTEYIISNTNFLVSFAGNLTYPKNDYLKEAVKTLPLEKIVLETDCPFLAPQSKRGQRNDPTSIKEIAQLVAQLKNTTLEAVSSQTTLNTKTILKLV